MDHRALFFSLLELALATSCFQQIDSSADKGSAPITKSDIPFGSVPKTADGTIPDQTLTPGIQITTDVSKDPVGTTMSACDAINQQAMWTLKTNCGDCHGSQLSVDPANPTARGLPAWNFVDVPEKMLDPNNHTDLPPNPANGDPGVPFLKKGVPEGSRIYQRMLLGNTQGTPPQQVMPPTTTGRQLTVSDFSMLNAWIKNCLP
jgi:hypothetical protein